jgi:four helix bundle protein
MPDHEKLRVWKAAHELTLLIYRATEDWPRTETYGVTSQIRRATTSIGANIAEGAGRGTDNELRRFLRIAIGSANEVHNYLVLARDLEFLDSQLAEQTVAHVVAVRAQLRSFVNSLDID